KKFVAQSAVIPYRNKKGLEILLVTSLGTGRWVLPKGHVEDEMTPRESAIKEAFEEAGINGKVPDKKVGDYVYHKDDKIDGTTYKVAVYAMRVTYELDIWPEDNQRKREWMSVEKAAHSVDEIELRQLILGFAETVKK
ncbi:MAG: NUDIX hydrolase, partial [Pseudomonadota bacterium]|nr:NUDIX hydrolase [Pseudomonadota bacterium]